MPVKTTLSFTERHHRFLLQKVAEGVFATRSAAVASALEQMIQDDAERNVALAALAGEIRAHVHASLGVRGPGSGILGRTCHDRGGPHGVTYRLRLRPLVARGLDTIARWIIDQASVT